MGVEPPLPAKQRGLVDADQIGEVASRQPTPLPGVEKQQPLLWRDCWRSFRRLCQPGTATANPAAEPHRRRRHIVDIGPTIVAEVLVIIRYPGHAGRGC